jgi:molybdopterin/thiamine biosynthesis adenylyltransferase
MPDAPWSEITLDLAAHAPLEFRPQRGSRLPQFLGGRADAGPILDSLQIGVVGLGSVGRNLALHLARLQIGGLWLIDRGRFKAESLLTQPIGTGDVGEGKAANAGRVCKQLSPATRVHVWDGAVEALPAIALLGADLVALATDNLTAEVDVGQRCLWLQKPLIQASVHGETLVAQARFFNNSNGEGPCPACAFGRPEWAHLNQETTFSCEGTVTEKPTRTIQTAPTRSVSFLCSLAADLALMQILRDMLGLGGPVQDTLVEYCGFTHRTVTAPLVRNPQCPCDHRPWAAAPAPGPLAECTLRQLAVAAGVTENRELARTSFRVEDWPFVVRGVCANCGQTQAVQRFVAGGEAARPCVTCSGIVAVQPFFAHHPVPATMARAVLDRPLAELGSRPPGWVVVQGQERTVLFR